MSTRWSRPRTGCSPTPICVRRWDAPAREHCLAHFSLDAVAARWLSLLEPLLESAPRSGSGRMSAGSLSMMTIEDAG